MDLSWSWKAFQSRFIAETIVKPTPFETSGGFIVALRSPQATEGSRNSSVAVALGDPLAA